ncbi:NAD-dependent epimerase/dehydratase family protein [Candidatus Pelagibacter communis]|uniref:NAD-dependent epimerase/dehydratase family protein n=1 Tax=Pelagibacter ubique TaxID=198252 RepID=UPI00094C74A2|nr:NAD(P)-dependent oxidoreductase [Candidatus Pelagibacter ubique]
MNLKDHVNFFENKKVLVTGGTGLIGRFVVNKLCELNADVTVVSLDELKLNNKAIYIKGDLTDFEFCKKISKNIDFAFHISGVKGSVKVTIEKPSSFFVPLIMMNTNFLEACRLNKVKRLVYTSSIGAYSSREIFIEDEEDNSKPPMDMYPGWAKRMAEMQILAYKKQYNLNNFFAVRPCNVYGPGDNFDPENAMVIPTLMNRIFKKEDPVVIWGDGSAIRDFAYAEDVADGIILTLIKGTGKFDFLNLGSGNGYSIKKLVETLCEIHKFNYKFDTSKDSGFPRRIMNIDNAKKILGFNPKYSLKKGLEETWSWYINNSSQTKKRHNYFK